MGIAIRLDDDFGSQPQAAFQQVIGYGVMDIPDDESGHPNTGVDDELHRRIRLTTSAAEDVGSTRAGFD